jgi:hypothetical protein
VNALEIVQQAAITLGFESPTTIEDPQDSNAQRLLGQLNRALEDILRDYDWQVLLKHAEFTADQSTFYNAKLKGYSIKEIAPGFNCFLSDYIYNNTERKLINSVPVDYYEYAKMTDSGGVIQKFLLQYNHISFMPELAKGTKLSFWYKSKYPVFAFDNDNNLILKQYFNADLDESDIDDVLLLRGLILKYKNEMGFDYAESYRDYEKILSKAKDQDANRRPVIGSGLARAGYPGANIPDTGAGL